MYNTLSMNCKLNHKRNCKTKPKPYLFILIEIHNSLFPSQLFNHNSSQLSLSLHHSSSTIINCWSVSALSWLVLCCCYDVFVEDRLVMLPLMHLCSVSTSGGNGVVSLLCLDWCCYCSLSHVALITRSEHIR